MRSLDCYSCLIFDCDGVVLDSNRIKTEAFRQAALPWGEAAADALADYHVARGGVSRYVKFRHFLDRIVPDRATADEGPGLEAMLETFSKSVRAGMMSCAAAEGLAELRAATPDARWLIVSGGDQVELRQIFETRGLAPYFDGGIFGSPDTKDKILQHQIAAGNIQCPALFLGDTRYDHEASCRAEIDFCFVSGWTEFADWREYVAHHDIYEIRRPADLLSTDAS